jgi:hypothetical protein
MLFRFRRGLPLLELVHHILQQLGVAQQIILDDAFDLTALIAAEGLGLREPSRWQGHGERKQRGGEGARITFHRCSSFCHQRR